VIFWHQGIHGHYFDFSKKKVKKEKASLQVAFSRENAFFCYKVFVFMYNLSICRQSLCVLGFRIYIKHFIKIRKNIYQDKRCLFLYL